MEPKAKVQFCKTFLKAYPEHETYSIHQEKVGELLIQ